MAVDPEKVQSMMNGRVLEKDNIKKMYQMVQDASEVEEKKNAMKHSVFFVGQLPLKGRLVDIKGTERIVNTTVPYDQLPEYMNYLLEGLTIPKLLIKRDDGSYEVNTKYEKSVIKARKLAKAYHKIHGQQFEDDKRRIQKMYQMGTKYYHDGDYEKAAACFMNTVEMCEYRMGYYSLAMMYYEGKGVDKKLKEALGFIRNAIVRGTNSGIELEQQILSELEA